MSEALVELFKHNLWANSRLLKVCDGLKDEQLNASVPGTYGRVGDTLTHLVAAEERYVARLVNEPPNDEKHERHGFPGVGELQARAQESGKALITIAEGFEDGKVLQGTWRGEPYKMRAVVLLVQAINHATEHRAHVATILTQQGVEPPDIDGWAYAEEAGLMDNTEG